MSALVGYGSSDDEEDERFRSPHTHGTAAPTLPRGDNHHTSRCNGATASVSHNSNDTKHEHDAIPSKADVLHSTVIGAQAPPIEQLDSIGFTGRLSPYSANRVAIRNLTLPTMASLDIPPSPPGSPPPGISHKFEHFMQLKKQGMHFNDKLAGSSALKNPMLLQKLMSSAGLTEIDQYATTLSTDVWDPTAFPAWAYKEELAKSQLDIARRKADENKQTQRDCVDFVPATNAGNVRLAGTPATVSGLKAMAGGAAERVGARLNMDGSWAPQEMNGGVRRDSERRKNQKGH
ncbi:MAG: hypothetical protein Q9209_006038 [Squamulea sp. 1 TL-2023]